MIEKRGLRSMPQRYILTILGFLGFINVYALRVNINVAIVSMVIQNASKVPNLEKEAVFEEFVSEHTYNNSFESIHRNQGEFEWDSQMQGLVLGSFFYGYVLTQIPGGFLSGKYNAKWIYGMGILITALFTLLTPVAARWSVWALVIVRVIEGLASGVVYPSMNTLIGRWSPVMERSRMSSVIYSGGLIGSVVSMTFSGVLCNLKFLGGWPLAFYVFGILGCVWFIFWMALVDESPYTHPNISKEELLYIEQDQEEQLQNAPVPWASIFTSVPVWALILIGFAADWGSYTLLIELPTYLFHIFHFDVMQSGVLCALPQLLASFGSLFGAIISDKLRASGRLHITTIRKIMASIGLFIPAIFIIIISHIECRSSLILALFSLTMGFQGVGNSGGLISHVDMSPVYSGILFGITNTVGNFSGFLVPSYVSWIVGDEQTIGNWRKVFVSSAAIYTFSGIIYLLFGSSALQTWERTSYSHLITEEKHFEIKKKLARD